MCLTYILKITLIMGILGYVSQKKNNKMISINIATIYVVVTI